MMNALDELRHVKEGPAPGEEVHGAGIVRFLAAASAPADGALSRAKQVMVAWLSIPAVAVDDLGLLRRSLPSFFVGRFRTETTQEQDDAFLAQWRAADHDRQRELEQSRGWSLSEWAHWMKPDNRTWWWLDAKPVSDEQCALAVVVDEWPFPWEALKVLLINCGFKDVQPESE